MSTDLRQDEQANDFSTNGDENAPDEIVSDPPVPESFTVRDANSANWVIRRIVEARAYQARIAAWAAREKRRAEHDEEFFFRAFGYDLEQWAAQEVMKLKGRRKSLCLPAGTLSFRRQNPKLVIDNEGLVIKWAKHNLPEAVIVSERLLKTPLNEHFEASGELPDGVHLEPEREVFRVS